MPVFFSLSTAERGTGKGVPLVLLSRSADTAGGMFPFFVLLVSMYQTDSDQSLFSLSLSLQSEAIACPDPRFERDADEGEKPARVQAHRRTRTILYFE